MTPRSSNRAARPTPRTSRPGRSTSGSARSMRFSPRRSAPRQAHRLPPISVRISRLNRQGWPSSQRIVGGSSSPSVRRSRSRPVLASRSTSAAWSLRRTNRRVPRRSLAARAGAVAAGEPCRRGRAVGRAAGVRRDAVVGLVQQGQEQAVLGVVLDVGGAGAYHQGRSGPHSPVGLRWRRARSMTTWLCVWRGGHVEHVDQQPLGVPVDRLGTRGRLAGAGPRLAPPDGPPVSGRAEPSAPLGARRASRRGSSGARGPGRSPGASRRGRTAQRQAGQALAAQVHLEAGLGAGVGLAARHPGRHRRPAAPPRSVRRGRLRDQADAKFGADCRNSARVRQQERRPEVLARLALRAEVRAGARRQQLGAAEPEPDPVLGRCPAPWRRPRRASPTSW